MLCTKLLRVTFVLMPIIGFSSTFTWNGTISSDLNTASNWSPTSVPGTADDVIFDSTIPSINLSPSSSAGFSISTFNFNNSAQAFSFLFDQCTLTFNGAGITGNPTNTTIVSNNTNNGLSLSQQFFFSNGTANSSGSANLTANNSGTASGMNSGVSSSLLNGRQIYSANPFSMLDGGQLTSTNTGNDSTTGTGGNNIGSTSYYSQIEFDSSFTVGNNAGVTTTNMGTYSGSNMDLPIMSVMLEIRNLV